MSTGFALLDQHGKLAPPSDDGWKDVVSDARATLELEDQEMWALVTSMWDEDDTPEEGQYRKLP